MGVVIEIPSALKQYVNDQDEVEVSGNSVEEAFGALVSEYTELKANLFDENGKIRSFINIYLNDDDIRYADVLKSEVQYCYSIHIVPSVACGCSTVKYS